MGYPVITAPFLRVDGMAVYPCILVKTKALKHDEALIRHETIHLKQAEELLVIPFYLLYLANYLANLVKYRRHLTAYMQIIFEREAYRYEQQPGYFKSRKFWAWRYC